MGKNRRKSQPAVDAVGVSFKNANQRASKKFASPSTLPRMASQNAGRGRGRGGPPPGGTGGRGRPVAGGGGMQRNTRRGSMFGKTALPKDVIKGVEDISKAQWYVGKTPRVECDKAVLAGSSGTWLVRMSSSGDKYVICVNDSGSCQNFQVAIQGKKFSMGGKQFDSVMDSLHFLRANPINGKSGRLYYLGSPASDLKWYVGAMEKEECNKMVLAAGKSDYLVRLASDKKDYVLCINQGNGKAKNCKIYTGGQPNSFTMGTTTESALEDLLETLKDVAIQTNDGTGNLYLRKPAAKADYYAGQMPRAEAEGYVKRAGPGDYLIRQNTKGDKYVLVVNDGGHVLNFIISQTATGKFEFGGLPHDSLEMVIRYLKKAPLASKSGGQVFIQRPARMTDADDMIADVQFGFGDDDDDDGGGFEAPRRSLSRSGAGPNAPPAFASDDEDDEVDDEEEYDMPTMEKFQPFRVRSTREVTGVCPADVGLFVIAKKDDTTYLAVYSGTQVEIPMDAVEKEAERRASVIASDDDDDDDDDGFGDGDDDDEDDEDGDTETAEERAARLEALKEEKKAEMAAKLEERKREMAEKVAAENAAEEARIKEEMAAMQAKLAQMGDDDDDINGFGDDFDDDE